MVILGDVLLVMVHPESLLDHLSTSVHK
jgi:hypothetical protein